MITTVTGGSMEDSPLPTEKEVVPGDYRSGMMKFTVPAGGTQDGQLRSEDQVAHSRLRSSAGATDSQTLPCRKIVVAFRFFGVAPSRRLLY